MVSMCPCAIHSMCLSGLTLTFIEQNRKRRLTLHTAEKSVSETTAIAPSSMLERTIMEQ